MADSMEMYEKTIIADLHTPIKSFRLFALEQAISRGSSQDLCQALEEHQRIEQDDECRIMLSYALDAVKERIQPESPPGESRPVSLKAFIAQYETADKFQRLQLVDKIPQEWIPQLADWAWDRFKDESVAPVAAFLVKKFASSWASENLQSLSEYLCNANGVSIQLAVLEALTKLAPDFLVGFLPVLLDSGDPRLQSLAVRALGRIAPDEAGQHLEALLLGKDHSIKLAAIRDCFFLPFPTLKPILLKFISIERDPHLLELAGVYFQANPDPEIPFFLTEIMEYSLPEKGSILKKMLQDACLAVKVAGILSEPFASYTARLQKFIQEKVAGRKVREILYSLASENPGDWEDAEVALASLLDKPFVRPTLEKALESPLPERIRIFLQDSLRDSLDSPTRQELKPADSSRILTSSDLEKLSEREKISWFSRLTADDHDLLSGILHDFFQANKNSSDLIRIAVKTARRLRIHGFWDPCFNFSGHFDENLAFEAIEYLAMDDAERFLPFLGKFLKSTKPRLRTGALKILQRHDPVQAVSALMTILKTATGKEKGPAFHAMMNFDFVLIRDGLVDFIGTPAGKEFLTGGLFFFTINPDSDNLALLYRLERRVSPEEAKVVKQAREDIVQKLIELKICSPDSLKKIHADIAERWELEEKKRTAALPRVAPLPRIPRWQEKDEPESFFGGQPFFSNRSLLLPVGLFLGAMALSSLVFAPGPSKAAKSLPASRRVPISTPAFQGNLPPKPSADSLPPILSLTAKDPVIPRFSLTAKMR